MPHIEILSASIRIGRNSHKVALYFKKYLELNELATAHILDLKEYDFPLFDERLQFQESPSQKMLDFSEKIKAADGVLVVTPEYNGGYPASLKNAIDLLHPEWHRKPVAISAVSDGDFGGTQVLISLQFSLWKIGAWTVPARFHVQNVIGAFDEDGNANDKIKMDKRAAGFIKELLWCIEAKRRMTDYI